MQLDSVVFTVEQVIGKCVSWEEVSATDPDTTWEMFNALVHESGLAPLLRKHGDESKSAERKMLDSTKHKLLKDRRHLSIAQGSCRPAPSKLHSF